MDVNKLYSHFLDYSLHVSHIACHVGLVDSVPVEMVSEIRDLAKSALRLRGKPTGSVDSEQSASRLLGIVFRCIRELRKE